MAHKNNWVKVNRSIFDNYLWKSGEPFDCRSAWIDLILLANHEDGYFRTSKGVTIKIPRGSHFTSVRKLSERWHWSVGKVERYLRGLTDTQMITQSGTQSGTLLSLVNYDDYQGQRYTDEHTNEHTDEYTNGYTNEYTDGIRTRNKEEKENEIRSEEAFSPSFDFGSEDDDENDYWNEVNDDDERRSEESIPDDRRKLDVPPRTFNYADKVRKLIYGIERLSDPRGGTGNSECDS